MDPVREEYMAGLLSLSLSLSVVSFGCLGVISPIMTR